MMSIVFTFSKYIRPIIIIKFNSIYSYITKSIISFKSKNKKQSTVDSVNSHVDMLKLL